MLSVRQDTNPHLLRLTQQGEVLQDLRVPVGKLPEVVQFSNPASIGGSKFVVAVSNRDAEGKAQCFVADFDAAAVKELAGFDSFAITALAGLIQSQYVFWSRMTGRQWHQIVGWVEVAQVLVGLRKPDQQLVVSDGII